MFFKTATFKKPYEEHIKSHPYCFRAYLESKEAQELISFEDEELFQEGLIGSYQNWFMEKAGHNKMKENYEKLLETVKFYAEADYEVKVDRQGYMDSSAWITVLPDILEDAGEKAKEVLKEIVDGK